MSEHEHELPAGVTAETPPAEPNEGGTGLDDETPGTPGEQETEQTEEDVERPGIDTEGFDVDKFAKSLPEGAMLCPNCVGFGAIPAVPPLDPHRQMCPGCYGYGTVRTGSIVAEFAEQKCEDCSGRGFVDRGSAITVAPIERPAATGAGVPRDIHGNTPDNPEFDWGNVVRDLTPA